MILTSVLGGQRPDLTPAQLVGVLVAGVPVIATLLRAFGVYDTSPEQQQALQEAVTWAAVVAGLLFASDAGLRASRNAADAKREAAAFALPVPPHSHASVDEDPDLADEARFAALLGGDPPALPDAPDAPRSGSPAGGPR